MEFEIMQRLQYHGIISMPLKKEILAELEKQKVPKKYHDTHKYMLALVNTWITWPKALPLDSRFLELCIFTYFSDGQYNDKIADILAESQKESELYYADLAAAVKRAKAGTGIAHLKEIIKECNGEIYALNVKKYGVSAVDPAKEKTRPKKTKTKDGTKRILKADEKIAEYQATIDDCQRRIEVLERQQKAVNDFIHDLPEPKQSKFVEYLRNEIFSDEMGEILDEIFLKI
jgi:cell division protein FtsI/penicillin-binding protein 2